MNSLPSAQQSDRYGGVALGVECAWPVAEPGIAIVRAPAASPALPLLPLATAAGPGAGSAFFLQR